MKTQRRHELQTNQLADSLAHWIEAIKPYSRAALAGLIAVVILALTWGYLRTQSADRAANGWNEYYDAVISRDPKDALEDISKRYAGTPVGQWSRLVLADLELDGGTTKMFIERSAARDELKQAVDRYRSVLADATQQSMLERATFGLARAYEGLGQLDDARKEYKGLVDRWPDSPYAAGATERAKDLDSVETKGFYDWFAKYEPPRPMSREPGTPGLRPNFMKDPIEENSNKLPSSIDDNISLPKFNIEPTEGPKPGEEGAAQKPADSEKPEEKPAEPPPSEESAPQPK